MQEAHVWYLVGNWEIPHALVQLAGERVCVPQQKILMTQWRSHVPQLRTMQPKQRKTKGKLVREWVTGLGKDGKGVGDAWGCGRTRVGPEAKGILAHQEIQCNCCSEKEEEKYQTQSLELLTKYFIPPPRSNGKSLKCFKAGEWHEENKASEQLIWPQFGEQRGTTKIPGWRLLRHLINFGITQTFPLSSPFFCQPHSWNLGLNVYVWSPFHWQAGPSLWMHIPGDASGLEDQCFLVQVSREFFPLGMEFW